MLGTAMAASSGRHTRLFFTSAAIFAVNVVLTSGLQGSNVADTGSVLTRRVRIQRRLDPGAKFGKFGAPRGSPSCPASTQCSPISACVQPLALSAFEEPMRTVYMGQIHAKCHLDPLDYPKADAGEDGICCPIVKTCPELKACRPPTTCDSRGEALPKKGPKNTDLEFLVQLTKCEPPKKVLEANPTTFGFCCSTMSSEFSRKNPDPMAEKRLDRDTFGLRSASKSKIIDEAKNMRRKKPPTEQHRKT